MLDFDTWSIQSTISPQFATSVTHTQWCGLRIFPTRDQHTYGGAYTFAYTKFWRNTGVQEIFGHFFIFSFCLTAPQATTWVPPLPRCHVSLYLLEVSVSLAGIAYTSFSLWILNHGGAVRPLSVYLDWSSTQKLSSPTALNTPWPWWSGVYDLHE